MSLREKINKQFNAALKSKNKTLISTLRLIMAAIKERDIANRTAEKAEIQIIDSFLPKQLSDEETKKICKETIKSLGASSIKDMGKIMGSLKQKYSDTIDFSKVNIIVKGLLN